MNQYGPDYLAARLSVWDLGLSRLGGLRPVAGYRAWQEKRRALRDGERLDAHLRLDIGLVPDGLHPPVDDCAAGPAEAANDNRAAAAA